MATNPPRPWRERAKKWLRKIATFLKWALAGLMLALPYWWFNTQSILDLGIWPVVAVLAYLVWSNHNRGKQNRILRNRANTMGAQLDQQDREIAAIKQHFTDSGNPVPPLANDQTVI